MHLYFIRIKVGFIVYLLEKDEMLLPKSSGRVSEQLFSFLALIFALFCWLLTKRLTLKRDENKSGLGFVVSLLVIFIVRILQRDKMFNINSQFVCVSVCGVNKYD